MIWIFGLGVFFLVLSMLMLFSTRGRRILMHPHLFPYSVSFFMRISGWVSYFAWTLNLRGVRATTSVELSSCLRSTKAGDLVPLRNACLTLDSLPTVRKGKDALELSSVFDAFAERLYLRSSPYTHVLQTPSFLIPGVPAKPYYDSTDFAFTHRLEERYREVRGELQRLLDDQKDRFQAYSGGHGHVQPGWNNFYFYLFGKRVDDNCALCPKTAELLDSIPRLEKTMAMFAALNPHSELPPHTGPANGILRVHLPLLVPENCTLTVAHQDRCWKEGKVLIFDDSFIHHVRNDSTRVRVVLFFSVFHPCFADLEIPALETFGDAWKALPVTQLYESLQHRPIPNNLVIEPSSVSLGGGVTGR